MTNLDNLNRRIAAAMHAVQSGVAATHAIDASDGTPKHLRTGINAALVADAALVRLLIAKGIMTEEDYLTALAAEAEAEVARYEERLSAHYGRTIRLA